MHRVPAESRNRRIIDADRVCKAIDGLGDPATIGPLARRFALLGDPTRLRLLLCIGAAGPISVSDLAVATTLSQDHVSQALRFLRTAGAVTAERDGRVVRYQIADPAIADLVDGVRHA